MPLGWCLPPATPRTDPPLDRPFGPPELRGGPVTPATCAAYVRAYATFRTATLFQPAVFALQRGLADVLGPGRRPAVLRRLAGFSPLELQVLFCGDRTVSDPVDWPRLRAAVHYYGYRADEPYMAWFWGILELLPTEAAHRFIAFVTGSPHEPLAGWAHLSPAMVFRRAPNPERLPTAMVCAHQLSLPRYSTRHNLERKLLQALSAHVGFGMV